MEEARRLREKGNNAFKVGAFVEAEKLYSQAMESSRGECEEEFILAAGNRAQVNLKLGNCAQAVEDCLRVLERDADNWKAWFRQARALHELMKLQDALRCIDRVLSLQGRIPAEDVEVVKKKRLEIKEQLKTYTPPPISPLEKQALVNASHVLRLYMQNNAFHPTVPHGVSRFSVQVYLANEFGLFLRSSEIEDTALVPQVLVEGERTSTSKAVVRTIIARHEEQGEVKEGVCFAGHGRVTVDIELSISETLIGSYVQVYFGTTLPDVTPVLSLPMLVIPNRRGDPSDQKVFYSEFGLDFSCCRLLDISPLIAFQVFEAAAHLGIAGKVWDGCSTLLRFLSLESSPVRVQGMRCLELGAGTGALSIGLAMLGAASVTVTDLPDVLRQLVANVSLNERVGRIPSGRVSVAGYAWGEESIEGNHPCLAEYDLALFADCIYDPECYASLLKSLVFICERNTSLALVWAHRHRNPEDYRFFEMFDSAFDSQLLRGPGPKFLVKDSGAMESLRTRFLNEEGTLVMPQGTVDVHGRLVSEDVSIYYSVLKSARTKGID